MPYYGPQYGPSGQVGRVSRPSTPGNPLAGASFPYLQSEYFQDHPDDLLSWYRQQQPRGTISEQYEQWRNLWLGQQPANYQAARVARPELGFVDYLREQDPMTAYELAHPYSRGVGAMFRPRYIRRF